MRSFPIVALVASLALGGCAFTHPPTTKLDLTTGTYESPKDIKAQKIGVRVTDHSGQVVKDVQIEGLDSSASSVITAQAAAMQAQAEALTRVVDALGLVTESIAGRRMPIFGPSP